MLDHQATLLALRSNLLSTVFATTGTTTLTATETGFTRAAGSFVTDGFVAGLEVVPTGFADNSIGIIKTVEAGEITLRDDRTAEVAGAGRDLTVGIPVLRGWENTEEGRIAGRWYIDEDYLPGISSKDTIGPLGENEHFPIYVLTVEGLDRVGVSALYLAAYKIMLSFPPMLAITLPGGEIVRVRTDSEPYQGQLVNRTAGTAEITITIPLIARTINPI